MNNHEFPIVFRTKFQKDFVLDVTPDVIKDTAGFYIQKGSMKGTIVHGDREILIDFPEKSLLVDEGYKIYPSDELIEWDNEYQAKIVLNHGWKLTVQEDNTITICLVTVPEETNIIDIVNSNGHIYRKNDKPNLFRTYSVKVVSTEAEINFPKDHWMCLAKGKVNINGATRKAKYWAKSSKDQILNVVNTDSDESVIFLSKIK